MNTLNEYYGLYMST